MHFRWENVIIAICVCYLIEYGDCGRFGSSSRGGGGRSYGSGSRSGSRPSSSWFSSSRSKPSSSSSISHSPPHSTSNTHSHGWSTGGNSGTQTKISNVGSYGWSPQTNITKITPNKPSASNSGYGNTGSSIHQPNAGSSTHNIGWSPSTATKQQPNLPSYNTQHQSHVQNSNSWKQNAANAPKPSAPFAPSAPHLHSTPNMHSAPSAPASTNYGWKITPKNIGSDSSPGAYQVCSV